MINARAGCEHKGISIYHLADEKESQLLFLGGCTETASGAKAKYENIHLFRGGNSNLISFYAFVLPPYLLPFVFVAMEKKLR